MKKTKHSYKFNYVLEHPKEYSAEQIEETKRTNEEFNLLCEKIGVKRGCSFHVRLVNHKKSTMERFRELFPYAYQTEHHIGKKSYAFLFELESMGDYDGYSQWYGGNQNALQLIKEGILVVNKEQTKKSSLI